MTISPAEVYDLIICVFVFPLLAFGLAAIAALVETARDGLIRRSYGLKQRSYRSKPAKRSARPDWWTSAKPYSLDELTSYGKPRKE
jgi:hypothetical protein